MDAIRDALARQPAHYREPLNAIEIEDLIAVLEDYVRADGRITLDASYVWGALARLADLEALAASVGSTAAHASTIAESEPATSASAAR